ncbi:hypothetical protein ACFL1X_07650 [Candidatus Hydrogenedentota bacterium]
MKHVQLAIKKSWHFLRRLRQVVGRRTILVLLLLLIAIPARVALLREPLNSDDASFRYAAVDIVNHNHVVQIGGLPEPERGAHHQLRFGIVLPVAAAIAVWGDSFVAYYLWPLFFSFVAIVSVFLLLRMIVGDRLAFLASLVHIVNPLEVQYSSILLTNLPTAVVVLAYVVLITRESKETEPEQSNGLEDMSKLSIGFLCGLLLTWTYLLRISAPITVVPAILLCFLAKRNRRIILVSLVFLCVAVLFEQIFYMILGGKFGYRFMSVKGLFVLSTSGFSRYDNAVDYILRYPKAVWIFSRSYCVTIIFCLALFFHCYVIVFTRTLFLRAVALCGLFNFALFSFSLVEPLSKGFATLPPMSRYIQLFLLTSVLCIPWGMRHLAQLVYSCQLAKMFAGSDAGDDRNASRLRVTAHYLVLTACFLAFFVPMTRSSFRLPGRLLSTKHGTYLPILCGINEIMESGKSKSVEVVGTVASLDAINMFDRLPGNKSIVWRKMPLEDCMRLMEEGTAMLFLMDSWREYYNLRYLEEPEASRMAKKLEKLERIAAQDYEVVHRNKRFLLSKSRNLRRINVIEPGL